LISRFSPAKLLSSWAQGRQWQERVAQHLIGLETPDAGRNPRQWRIHPNPEIASKYRLALVFQSGALFKLADRRENVGL